MEVKKLLAVIVTTWIEIVKAAFVLSLLIVYAKNYRTIRSKFSLGLLTFTVLMLIEATVAIYLYSTTALCRVAEIYEIVRPLLSAIECVSFAILAWITWK
jgi:hypothetical protein